MSCATGFVKVVMFVFNFIISLAGIGLITIGALFYVKVSDYDTIVDSVLSIAPTLSLIIGIIVFIIAFFGCCGAIRESHCMLVTYAVFLLTLFALQLGLGIYAYLQVKNSDGEIEPIIKKNMGKLFDEYKTNAESKELFDVAQKELHCCGLNGPEDYFQIWKLNVSVPATCCKNYNGQICITNYWSDGCVKRVSEFVANGIGGMSYAAIGISGIEIIGAVFALCLASSIKNEYRRRYS